MPTLPLRLPVFRLTAVRLVPKNTSAALPTVNSHIICDRLQIVNSNRITTEHRKA